MSGRSGLLRAPLLLAARQGVLQGADSGYRCFGPAWRWTQPCVCWERCARAFLWCGGMHLGPPGLSGAVCGARESPFHTPPPSSRHCVTAPTLTTSTRVNRVFLWWGEDVGADKTDNQRVHGRADLNSERGGGNGNETCTPHRTHAVRFLAKAAALPRT